MLYLYYDRTAHHPVTRSTVPPTLRDIKAVLAGELSM